MQVTGKRSLRTNSISSSANSFVTPGSVYDYDMEGQTSTLLKQNEVPGYDRAQYTSERIWATAGDGTKVPVSLVYRKSVDAHSGRNPLWLTAYGSYGSSSNAGRAESRPLTARTRSATRAAPLPTRVTRSGLDTARRA